MKISLFSIKSILFLLFSFLFVNSYYSQERKINKVIEHIQLQKFDVAEEVIIGLKKKNATLPTTYYVQSMLYGSKTFKRYNIDSSYIFYNQSIEGVKLLDSKEQTDICTDFKLCLSRSQIVKDSIAEIAFNQYKIAKSIEKMRVFNSLYKGTASIQQSNELIEYLYYKISIEINTTQGFLDFLKMYPNNVKREFVLSKIHKIEYDLAVSKNEKSVYQNYLTTYPTSEFCDEIRNNIELLDYNKTKSSLEIVDFEEFMNTYSNSTYAQEILMIYETLYYNDAINKREISQLNKFKMRYPTSKYISEIHATICDIAFENVTRINTMDAYKEFVKSFPNSKYDKEAKNKIIELFPIVPKLLLNGNYKYIDKNTGLSINNKEYEKVNLFENNQVIVMQNSKYGVIDEHGRAIIPTQYDDVSRCTNPDLYLVTINNKMNVFNNEGRQLLKADSDIELREQNNDFIGFNNRGKEYSDEGLPDYLFRIVNKELVKYQCPYDAIPEFNSTGIAIVSKGKTNEGDDPKLGLYALINKDFQEIIPFKYDYIEQVNGYDELYYFNVGGSAGYGEGGMMIVAQGGEWGLMKSTGKVLIPAVFDKLEFLDLNNKTKSMCFLANRGRKISDSEEPNVAGNCGLIDINGNEIIPFEYQEIFVGLDNQFIVNKGGAIEFGRWGYTYIIGGKWGVVDISNMIKIPFIYDDLYKIRQYYIVAKGPIKGSKHGILSIDNKIITPLIYDYITCDYQTEKILLTCMGCRYYSEFGGPEIVYGGQWGAIQNNGKLILNNNFSEILTTNDSNLLILNTGKIYGNEFPGDVKYDGKYGLSDINGKLILPLKFDEITVETNFIFAKLQGKYQIYTKTGELFLDKKFESLSALSNNFISYRSGEKNGILKPDGSELFPAKFWATKNEDGYSCDIGLDGPYFKIVEAGNYFYVSEKGDIFREY